MTLPQSTIEATFAAPCKIVVATDLTDTEYLLPHAIAQAKASNASLVLVHAVLPHESMPVETLSLIHICRRWSHLLRISKCHLNRWHLPFCFRSLRQ